MTDIPLPRIAVPPSIRVQHESNLNRNSPFGQSPSSPRPLPFSRHSGPMSIPRAREDVPPPLPPPRLIDMSNDLGWKFGNRDEHTSFGRHDFLPINPSSSLCGGMQRDYDGRDEEMGRPPFVRRSSSQSTVNQHSEGDYKQELPHFADEGYHSLSGSSIGAYPLKSEKPLAQRNLEDSSQNYDKQLLSKFGKPPSPSRLSNYGSLGPEVSPKNRFPFQLKSPSSLEISSIQSDSVSSRWPGSPKSVAISPGGGRTCWDYRSPSTDESSAPSSAIDPELRKASRGSLPSILDDTSSLVSRSQRGSYDQTNCEVDRPLDETGRIGQLHIGERTEGNSGSKQGMKRRASSPVQDVWREDNKVSLQNLNGSNSGARRPSPVHRLHPNHGSVSSSTSSMMGIRNGSLGSLGSSMALSVGSSMTSMSGFERFSPGGISPSSEAEFGQQMQESPYQTAASLNPSPRQSLSRAHPNQQTVPTLGIPSVGLSTKHPQHPQQSSVTSSTSDRQPSVTAMSVDPSLNGNPYAIQPPKMQGGYFCECCQKKPKKFNTLEELQAHRDEKQYTCQYCHNRFKNKNEAERHQNSLHLRRHSWSCAALSSYQAAFHPSPHPSTLTPAGPTVDLCGYCGMGFPYPPDWEQRYDHLTTSHKFGECNQSKKFYRADHFRQHLKHSHAGTSGKWTNMLENACMRDETPQSERLGSLSSEAGRGAGSSSGTPIMTKTINEVHDES